jgi:hypothetical protein
MKKIFKNNTYFKVTLTLLMVFFCLIFSAGCSPEKGLSCNFPYSKSLFVIRDYIFTTYTSLCGGDVLESGILIANTEDPEIEISRGGSTKDWANDIFVEGKYAYVANGNSGLLIVNISDSKNPFEEGRIDTPGYANSVFVAGDIAFIADGENGIQVIKIDDKEAPVIIKEYDTPGYASDVHIYDGKAYVADGGKGVFIIEIDLIK